MPDLKYVHIKISDIPDEFIDKYKLTGQDRDRWIYFKIHQGCYSLPQAGILANDILCSRLEAKGFYEATSTPSLWCHKWQSIQCRLIVDNFGIEYVGLKHFNYLLGVLKNSMVCNTTWPAINLQAFTLNWTAQPVAGASVCLAIFLLCF
jgi:hypothetical protein